LTRTAAVTIPKKILRPDLAGPSRYDYYFVYMKNLLRKALHLIIATSALSFAPVVGAQTHSPGGHQVSAAGPRQPMSATSHQQGTVAMQTARHSPDVKIPPLDAAIPARTETATFGLG
jgi:hypothetical protein